MLTSPPRSNRPYRSISSPFILCKILPGSGVSIASLTASSRIHGNMFSVKPVSDLNPSRTVSSFYSVVLAGNWSSKRSGCPWRNMDEIVSFLNEVIVLLVRPS
eukprot:773649-Amphidinium_carterae.1